jgi:hypothetical protein
MGGGPVSDRIAREIIRGLPGDDVNPTLRLWYGQSDAPDLELFSVSRLRARTSRQPWPCGVLGWAGLAVESAGRERA